MICWDCLIKTEEPRLLYNNWRDAIWSQVMVFHDVYQFIHGDIAIPHKPFGDDADTDPGPAGICIVFFRRRVFCLFQVV